MSAFFRDVLIGLCLLALVQVAAAYFTAAYAQRLGFPFTPIVVCCLLLPFPIVLLAVTVAGNRPKPTPPAPRFEDAEARLLVLADLQASGALTRGELEAAKLRYHGVRS